MTYKRLPRHWRITHIKLKRLVYRTHYTDYTLDLVSLSTKIYNAHFNFKTILGLTLVAKNVVYKYVILDLNILLTTQV